MSEKDINTKQSFINLIARTMRSMELKILVSGIDYSSPLPHLVAVYPDIEKYYLIEPISMECFSEESQRLYKQDEHKEVRSFSLITYLGYPSLHKLIVFNKLRFFTLLRIDTRYEVLLYCKNYKHYVILNLQGEVSKM